MPPHHPLFVRKGFCKKKWQTQAAYPLVAVEPPSPFIKKGFCKRMANAGGVSLVAVEPPLLPPFFKEVEIERKKEDDFFGVSPQ